MKRNDKIKLSFTRNWNLPGKERLARILGISASQKQRLQGAVTWLEDEDIAIYADPGSYIEWTVLSTGKFEPDIAKLIRISLQNGDTALDIGMNIGLQSIRMSQAVGRDGRVLAFEPLEHICEKAKRNFELNRTDNVTIFSCALSDTAGEAIFEVNKTNFNQGTFSLKADGTGGERQVVHIKVGDDVDEIRQIGRLKLIKIDVEGFEFHVLRGLEKTLEKFHPRIIFELDTNYWVRSNQDVSACFDFLTSLGYTLYQITPVGCELIRQAAEIESGNIFCMPGPCI